MSDVAIPDDRQIPSGQPERHLDLAEWSFHHRVLYRLVLGSSSILTSELNVLYNTIAPVTYRGTMETPVSSRRHRRQLLKDLRDDGVLAAHKTDRGWVWIPTEFPSEEER